MNKVAILTLNGYSNYGNRLQNYALQEAIQNLNFKCETLINETNTNTISKSSRQVFLEKDITEKIIMIRNKINKKKILHYNIDRTKMFKDFSKKYINECDTPIALDNIPCNLNEQYDYFIVGSDQVWNPNIPIISEISFLAFATKNKRLTYAPSFGVSSIPEQHKKNYIKWLSGIDNISVREQEGANIIKELTGKEAVVVVDPTMLLTKEKWVSIAKKPINKPRGKYLLTYFLGGVSKEVRVKIKKIARQNKLEIVNLADIKDKKHYVTGPSEFIDYIKDASVFFTDSFHGCVFSVILETPFIVCDRLGHTEEQNMGSRIETFTTKFELQSRKFNNIKDEEIFSCDYKQVNKILESERLKSWDYLRTILKINSLN